MTEGAAEHDNLHFDFTNLSNPYVGLYECMDGAEGNLDSQGGAADNFLPGVSVGMRTNMKKFAAKHDMNYMGNILGRMSGCCQVNMCRGCTDHLEKVYRNGIDQIGSSDSANTNSWIRKFLQISLVTWNAAGLLCQDLDKYKAKSRFCQPRIPEMYCGGDTRDARRRYH